ncbi:MAG: hypothetical protein NTV29_09615 [Planctomycetota bacterium]|nr:hypothetical protein [Planctomycetota bacterium]
MSTNQKKPRRTFDQDFIDGAVKLVKKTQGLSPGFCVIGLMIVD